MVKPASGQIYWSFYGPVLPPPQALIVNVARNAATIVLVILYILIFMSLRLKELYFFL